MTENVNLTQTNRIEYIDITRALAMLCVCIGHTAVTGSVTKTAIYAFHMPLFFIISGLVIRVKDDKRLRARTIGNKAIVFLIPFLLWGCIYAGFKFQNVVLIAYGSHQTLHNAGSLTSLWFLPVSFIAIVLADEVVHFSAKHSGNVLIIFGAGAASYAIGFLLPVLEKYGYPWAINVAFVALAFVLIGYLLQDAVARLMNANVWIRVITLMAALGLLTVSLIYNRPPKSYVLMAEASYGNPILFMLGALGGSASIVILASFINDLRINRSPILYAGRNTMGLFLIHKPFVKIGCLIFGHFGLDYSSPILATVNGIVWMAVSACAVWVINLLIPEVFTPNRRL